MHYATHAIGPLLALAGALAEYVVCLGSGHISAELTSKYGSPFAVESALVKVRDSDLSAEITWSLFETARQYVESFSVYGDRSSFEWEQVYVRRPGAHSILLTYRCTSSVREARKPLRDNNHGQTASHLCQEFWSPDGGRPVLFAGADVEHLTIPDFAHVLPAEIQRYTTKGVYDDEHAHLSFKQGSGHGGSHPHLAHEFIRSIVEERKPLIDEVTAANWTSVGICAHQSAMAGGARVDLPVFRTPDKAS